MNEPSCQKTRQTPAHAASAADPSASYVYSWDHLDRMLTETATINGIAPQVRLTRGYDAVGNRTSLAADFISGATTTADFVNSYSFDANNRLQSMTQSAQGSGAGFHAVQDKLVTFAYNGLGQFTFVSRYESLTATGTNLRTVHGYDSANRLQNLSHRNIGTYSVLSDYVYSYDNQNRITQINHSAAVAGHADGVSDFNYDLASQLTAADHAPARPDENLAYDANGNRTNAGYTTGANNQTLTSQDSTGQKYSYVYDGEGNRTRRVKLAANGTTVQGVEDYTWDHRNRLTNVTFRATVGGAVLKTVDYVYDPFNRLVKRSFDSNGPASGGVTDTYFAGYDGINPTLQFETAGGASAQTTDLKHRYLWGPVVDQLFADEQLSNVTTPGNTLWALSDHLGTIRDIADFDGTSFAIVNHRVFNSFGVLTSETNTAIDMAFAYTGKLLDETTGLSLHWNRWYDPGLGKWISEDPIGFLGGDANLARYVNNGVAGFRDSKGHAQESFWDWFWGTSANVDSVRERVRQMEQTAQGRSRLAEFNAMNASINADYHAKKYQEYLDSQKPRIASREITRKERAIEATFNAEQRRQYYERESLEYRRNVAGLGPGPDALELRRMEERIAQMDRSLQIEDNPWAMLAPGTAFNIWDNGLMALGGLGATPNVPGLFPSPPRVPLSRQWTINTQQQAGHVKGTAQYNNRAKQGKPTSTFSGKEVGERLTIIAAEKGTPVKPNVVEFEFGLATGTGVNGGTQTRVRVHMSPLTGEIHGHPAGPEKF